MIREKFVWFNITTFRLDDCFESVFCPLCHINWNEYPSGLWKKLRMIREKFCINYFFDWMTVLKVYSGPLCHINLMNIPQAYGRILIKALMNAPARYRNWGPRVCAPDKENWKDSYYAPYLPPPTPTNLSSDVISSVLVVIFGRWMSGNMTSMRNRRCCRSEKIRQ
ncbi:hypothetical protein CEXT_473121 [Caerostris extrusa]|uniref:Uncharacterized protein n=1 Tax=Caerostris extrusa TaxID=172846 RepID=A0AAV4NIG4_CAEEX|nr:hypothetical protein CEXT_473121 [Caerostris extrusa]